MERVVESMGSPVAYLNPPETQPAGGFIEVINRSGQVTERLRIEQLPMCVGRAYDNDLILDDPYVSPQHVRIRMGENHRLIFEDLDSLNGIVVHGNRTSATELAPGGTVRLGQTRLRYRDAQFEVAETLVDRSVVGTLKLLKARTVFVLAILLAAVLAGLESFFGSVEPIDAGRIVYNVMLPFGTLIVWAGFWALASKLIVHRAYFTVHLSIACLALAAGSLGDTVLNYGGFILDMDAAAAILNPVFLFLLATATLYAHSRFCTLGRPLWIGLTAAFLSLGAVGLLLLQQNVDKPDFSRSPRYATTLKAPIFEPISHKTPEAYFGRTDKLQEKLDKLVAGSRRLHSNSTVIARQPDTLPVKPKETNDRRPEAEAPLRTPK